MSALTFERLEQRQLLAGNVTAVMKGSTLVITGDAADNGVFVEGQTDGTWTVESDAIFGGDTTTINGSSIFQTPEGVKKIVVNMGDGNDRLYVLAVTFDGPGGTDLDSLTIKMGDGNDSIGQLGILTGLLDIHAKKVSVDLGNGDDSCQIATDVFGLDDTVIGTLNVKGGNGDDKVSISGCEIQKSLSVNLGAGDDTLSLGSPFQGTLQGNTFGTKTSFNGGKGLDELIDFGNNTGVKEPKVKAFETLPV
ncbi:MAG: hypothetical protein R3C01_16810 [Planctomycetaceae bacterium]